MLRPDTQALWDHLEMNPLLGGFVLVGGTALAMHLRHRVSEDLDFMIATNKLPRERIEVLKRDCADAGFVFRSNDPAAGLLEFEDTGMDYGDYQQDYVVADSVKLTFVAPDSEVRVLLGAGMVKAPRVASIEEIFRLKCIACANRTKSRDWLDMYILLQRGYFQPIDIYRTFELAGVVSKFDIAMMRMTVGEVPSTDEGFDALIQNPPSIDMMQEFFRDVFSEVQSAVAAIKSLERQQKKISPRPSSSDRPVVGH